MLPPNLPSSFEGGIGHVRYVVKGTIDRPWRFDDNCVRAFTVLNALDLNQLPEANVRKLLSTYTRVSLFDQHRHLHYSKLQEIKLVFWTLTTVDAHDCI